MEKPEFLLRAGIERLNLSVEPATDARLWLFATTLLRWNEKVNLTAIVRPEEVVEKHLIDSLAVLPEVVGHRLLDLGAGAGLPGIPLALARPAMQATLVDSVGKKVAFMKSAIVGLGLGSRVKAQQMRAAGRPDVEQLPRCDVVISRALMDVELWLSLAVAYLAPGGRIVAMMGVGQGEDALRKAAAAVGLELISRRAYTLPFSGDQRTVAVFTRPS